MYTLAQLIFFGSATAALVGHLGGVAVATALPGLPARVRRRLILLLLILGWYALWVGAWRSGLTQPWPRLANASQLFTGYAGPMLFLLTSALLRPSAEDGPLERWSPVGGLPATLLFFSTVTSADPAALVALKESRDTSGVPLLWALWGLHAAQLVGFVLASLVVVWRAWRKADDPEAQRRARWAVGPVAAILLGALVSVLLPLTALGGRLSGLGPALTLPAMVVALGAARHAAREQLRVLERFQQLGRYLPEQVVQRLVDGRLRPRLGGEQVVATVLFVDLRGFTTLSERLPPTEVVALLNGYLAGMVDEIFQHGGMVDKFIGDAVMAVFGVPDGDQDAARAVRCARALTGRIAEVNTWWTARGHPPVGLGVGVARGTVICGNIGTPSRMEYTVIGDTVNVASRVQGLAGELGVQVLLTDTVVEAAGPVVELLEVGTRRLRGRSGDTRLFTFAGEGPAQSAGLG